MAEITITRNWKVEGVLTSPTSMVLSDATGAYGVKRDDTDAVIVADGTAMTESSTGVFTYTFTEPAVGLSYTAWVEVVYGDNTYRFEHDIEAVSSGSGDIVDIDDVKAIMGLSDSITSSELVIIVQSITKAEAAVRRYLKYDPVQAERTEYYPQSNFARNSPGVWEANDNSAYIRQFNDASSTELQVKHIPIRSNSAMDLRINYDGRSGTQSGVFSSSDLKTEGTDYWPNYDSNDDDGNAICRDGIIRSNGLWPSQAGSVKIVYTAGYSSGEFQGNSSTVDAVPIWEVVLDETVRRAKKVFAQMKSSSVGWVAGPMISENLGSYSYSLDSASVSKLVGPSADLTTDSKERLADFVNWGYSLGGV